MKKILFALLFITIAFSQIDNTIAGWYNEHYYVPGGNVYSEGLIVVDESTLADESLNEPDFSSPTNWTRAGDFAEDTNVDYDYSHSTGIGSLTQIQGNLAIAGVGDRWYKFTYIISAETNFVGGMTITTGFASSAVSLNVVDGTHTVYFESETTPVDFVLSATSTAGSFTIDDVTLKRITGGDITVFGNILGYGSFGLTGVNAKIDFNPAGTDDIFSMIPTNALGAGDEWHGFHIDGSALDPSGVGAEILGLDLDFSGVDETNSPLIQALKLSVPFGNDALHINEGQLHINTTLPNINGSEFTGIDVVINASAQPATGSYHTFDVATSGGAPGGTVAAIGTHAYVKPIVQTLETFSTPVQADYAGVRHTVGTVWADGIDAYGEIFVVNSDEVLIGNTAGAGQFSAIEVIMTTPGTKSVTPTFWYNTAADTWTQFYPADDTDGFQQSGLIRWTLSTITGSWTNDGDPEGGDTETGYWIRIIRTANPDPGTPDPTTMKTGLSIIYEWDESGDLAVRYLGDAIVQSAATEFALKAVSGSAGANSFHLSFEGVTSVATREFDIYNEADAGTDTYRLTFALNGGGVGMAMDETGNFDVTGNIVVGGTVDGIDIATDVAANTNHRGLTNNPHTVTPAQLSLVIGTDTQAHDAALDNVSGLVYVSPSFIKLTADDTYAVRTLAEVRADLDLEAETDFYSKSAEDTWRNSVSQSEMGYLNGITSWGGGLIANANAGDGRTTLGVDAAGTDNSTDVTLNANATAGGLGLTAQEITFRAATNAQTGYSTAEQVTNQETNSTHTAGDGSDHADVASNTTHRGLYHTESATVTLSAAQVNALRGTPQIIVANQGANTWIELVSAVITYDYTATFTVGGDEDFVIEWADGTVATASIETTGFLDQASDEVRYYPFVLTAGANPEASINQALRIFNTGGGETADGSGSELDITVVYRVFTTGF